MTPSPPKKNWWRRMGRPYKYAFTSDHDFLKHFELSWRFKTDQIHAAFATKISTIEPIPIFKFVPWFAPWQKVMMVTQLAMRDALKGEKSRFESNFKPYDIMKFFWGPHKYIRIFKNTHGNIFQLFFWQIIFKAFAPLCRGGGHFFAPYGNTSSM